MHLEMPHFLLPSDSQLPGAITASKLAHICHRSTRIGFMNWHLGFLCHVLLDLFNSSQKKPKLSVQTRFLAKQPVSYLSLSILQQQFSMYHTTQLNVGLSQRTLQTHIALLSNLFESLRKTFQKKVNGKSDSNGLTFKTFFTNLWSMDPSLLHASISVLYFFCPWEKAGDGELRVRPIFKQNRDACVFLCKL